MKRRDILIAASALGIAPSLSRAEAADAAPIPPGEIVATKDGQRLFTKDWGAGQPVVFVSGQGLPSEMWDYQAVPLVKQGFRCVMYDRRGHGRSSIAWQGYDFNTLADDLAAVIEDRNLSGITLVGHSMGCAEIVRYLSRHGDQRVNKVVLVATAATPYATKTATYDEGPTPEQRTYFADEIVLTDYPKWMGENRAPFFTADTSELTQQWVIQMMLSTSLMAVSECVRHVGAEDFRAELPKIRRPTLVIAGDKDVSAPIVRSERTARLIPGAKLVVYEGAPHGLFITHAKRLTNDIAAFARANL
ncbi:MAG: alpha/beta fold hydrolase [Asticcacaulis sp.]